MNLDEIIEEEMYKRAIEFISKRYPKGWGHYLRQYLEVYNFTRITTIPLDKCLSSRRTRIL